MGENEEEIKEEEDDLVFDPNDNVIKNESKFRKDMKLVKREDDDKQFEDEVEYEPDVKLRERFSKYKYMKSFAKNNWNIYDALPDYY